MSQSVLEKMIPEELEKCKEASEKEEKEREGGRGNVHVSGHEGVRGSVGQPLSVPGEKSPPRVTEGAFHPQTPWSGSMVCVLWSSQC